jgi:hypothetical protein
MPASASTCFDAASDVMGLCVEGLLQGRVHEVGRRLGPHRIEAPAERAAGVAA